MEEALHDVSIYRSFAGLDAGQDAMPDESTILRFRHLLEAHGFQRLAPPKTKKASVPRTCTRAKRTISGTLA